MTTAINDKPKAHLDDDQRAAAPRRLLVTRRDTESRAYKSLGFLEVGGAGEDRAYRFAYLRRAVRDGLRALPGLPLGREHVSKHLFPILAARVIAPGRTDRPKVLRDLHLHEDAGPFEVLARSGGRRVGDTIEVIPVPDPDAEGRVRLPFFVHGIRHLSSEEAERVGHLHLGQSLTLEPEPTNIADSRAMLVTDDGVRLGYVPRPLLDFVHDDLTDRHIEVVQVNGPDVGFHLRLLVELSGTVRPGRVPFSGAEWATI